MHRCGGIGGLEATQMLELVFLFCFDPVELYIAVSIRVDRVMMAWLSVSITCHFYEYVRCILCSKYASFVSLSMRVMVQPSDNVSGQITDSWVALRN